MSADERHSLWGWVGAVWGVLGVSFLLGFAIYRLAPLAVEGLGMPLAWHHWAVFVVWVLFMGVAEGYRGFQKAFSPRVAARCRHLRDHPTLIRVALAPPFAMAFFGATRRRRIAAWALTCGIVVLVLLVHQLDQPWRGIIDAGVVIGLTWGLVAMLVYWFQAHFGTGFDVSPEVSEAPPASD